MRCCHIHIGMHKTGSTAIQHALRDYDDGSTATLRLAGENHSIELVAAFAGGRHEHPPRWLPRGPALAAMAEATRQALAAQARATRRNLILSGEELSAQFDDQAVAALRAVLAPHFDRLRVIVYVREPFAAMRSTVQEVIKSGAVRFDLPLRFPRYRDQLEPWFRAFGAADMDFVLYQPDRMPGGSVVADFARRVGIAVPDGGQIRRNTTHSAEATALILLHNLGRRESARSRLLYISDRGQIPQFGTTRFELDRAACAGIIARHHDQIAWVEDRLGHPLPPPEPARGDPAFRSEEDLLAFAETVAPAFRAWCRGRLSLRHRASDIHRLLRGRPLR